MSSIFDQIYEELFGHRCTKEGQAFERIAAVVSKLISPTSDVEHDAKLRGKISNSLYQIDILEKEKSTISFGEAKDYTTSQNKVGRADLQKLAGALLEVDVEKGKFFSATDFTAPAKKYAIGSKEIIGKEIDLFHIQPSIESDKKGRVLKIVLKIHAAIPDYDNSEFQPIFTKAAQYQIDRLLQDQGKDFMEIGVGLRELYNNKGEAATTIAEITSWGFGGDMQFAHGCFALQDHYFPLEGLLLELHGIEYRVPYLQEESTIEIIATGTPKILFKSEDGRINKLLTSEQLSKASFSDSGQVHL